jgi:uncharacterized membrane protein
MCLTHLKSLFAQRDDRILSIAIGLFVIILSAFALFKYRYFGYNSMDLGIYNQVFWNTVHAEPFAFTIHPGSYLGDHFEPFLLLLTPFYAIFQHPLTIVFFQTLGIALAAIPIYGIAKQLLHGHWPLFVSLFYLANPLIQNYALYEFHILSFFPFLFFSVYYFYQKRKFVWFLVFLLLTLSVREDIPGVVFFFGLFNVLGGIFSQAFRDSPRKDCLPARQVELSKGVEIMWGVRHGFLERYIVIQVLKRDFWFIVTPLVLSVLWFLVSIYITRRFGVDGSYKFGIYYSWLGDSWQEMATFAFRHPIVFFSHFFSGGTISMVVGLFIPFLFLPIFSLRFLLLALTPFLEMTLTANGGTTLVLYTHYSALFLPALFLAFIASLQRITASEWKWRGLELLRREKAILPIILTVSAVYNMILLGPLFSGAFELWKYRDQAEKRRAIEDMIKQVKPDDTVVATFAYLPSLSSRKRVFSLNYLYTGKTQYAVSDFPVPDDIDAVLIDFDELVTYFLQYHDRRGFSKSFQRRSENFQRILYGLSPVAAYDNTFLFLKDTSLPSLSWFGEPGETESFQATPRIIGEDFELFDTRVMKTEQKDGEVYFDLRLAWNVERKPKDDFQLKIQPKGDFKKEPSFRVIPLAYGYQETSEWQTGEERVIRYQLSFPSGTKSIELSLMKIESGGVTLSPLKTMKDFYEKTIVLDPSVVLNLRE